MFLELIGTVFAGFAVAGVVLFLNRLTGGHLPRWIMPVAAGLAMIGVTISMEYSWYSRTTATLPDGVVVAQSVDKKASFYQPWTYVTPYVDRFVAVDTQSLIENEKVPDQRILDLYFFGRWTPLNKVPVLFDCATPRLASLVDGVEFGDDGQVVNPPWVALTEDDAVLASACEVS